MNKPTMFVFLAALTATSGVSQINCLTIDDFTTGADSLPLKTPGTSAQVTQTGTMLGSVRGTAFEIVPNGNPFLQPAEVDIDQGSGIPLVMTTGLKTFWRLEMEYGVDLKFAAYPLNYFPTGCDRFRVTFDSASQTVNFNVVVFYGPDYGHHAQDGINLDPSPYTYPFCVDFLFSNFAPGIPNDTPDFAGKGILSIDFVFQSGSAIGGNEFAITKIETLDPSAAAMNPCAIVAPPL
jgi:hypothetical protein